MRTLRTPSKIFAMPLRSIVAHSLLLPVLLLAACANAPPETRHASHDAIRFVGKSGVARANGIFHEWRVVTADVDPKHPGKGRVEVEIDVASLDTDFPRRDDLLRDADYFNAAKWPHARVIASEARPLEEDAKHWRARFQVEIRDQRRVLEGDFQVVSERPLVITGALLLDRTLFGVGAPDSWWNPVAPRNEVSVEFRLTLQSR